MKLIVFLGPTISKEKVLAIVPNAIIYPPVKRGDIIHVLDKCPDIILIIDGYYETQASVQHKEILFALEKGVTVVGCSSMGALRAAELTSFGMIGVGQVFEDIIAENITDDDEVAVFHDSSSYTSSMSTMINIRYTSKKAFEEGVISKNEFEKIITISKTTFYKDRELEKILDEIHNDKDHKVKKWFSENYVNIKEIDAFSALKKIANNDIYLDKSKVVKTERTAIFSKLIRDVHSFQQLEDKEDSCHDEGRLYVKYYYKLAILLDIYISASLGTIESLISAEPSEKFFKILLALDGMNTNNNCLDKYYRIASVIIEKINENLLERKVFPSSSTKEALLVTLKKIKNIQNRDNLYEWLDAYKIKDYLEELLQVYFFLQIVVQARNINLLTDRVIDTESINWLQLAQHLLSDK